MVKWVFAVAFLLVLFLSTDAVTGGVSIGVKAGDWIEYTVSTTGLPPEGHDVVWARMEILSIVDGEIIVNTTTKAENGTFSNVVMTLNPSAGQIDVWAIIPANLGKGDSFFDKNLGNIPIMGQQEKTVGGVVRDTTFYNSSDRFKRWDKLTGVFLEGTDVLGNYSLSAIFQRTNMWRNQILGLDPSVFFVFVFFAALLAAGFAAAVAKGKKSLNTKVC
jgi:hypothetical protein